MHNTNININNDNTFFNTVVWYNTDTLGTTQPTQFPLGPCLGPQNSKHASALILLS